MRFKKEIILVVIIIIGIVLLESVTNYVSKQTVQKISSELDKIVKELEEAVELKENYELSDEFKYSMKNDIKQFKDIWYKEQDKLSLFFEHDELEKVTRSIVVLEENSKNEEFESSLENASEFRYWLYHFEEKEKMRLKNFL